MVGHGGSSAGSYLADPTSPIPSHCASIVATSTVRDKLHALGDDEVYAQRISKENAVIVNLCKIIEPVCIPCLLLVCTITQSSKHTHKHASRVGKLALTPRQTRK